MAVSRQPPSLIMPKFIIAQNIEYVKYIAGCSPEAASNVLSRPQNLLKRKVDAE